MHSYNINIPIIIVQKKITGPKFLIIKHLRKEIVMYKKKTQKIIVAVLAVILILAMVIPLAVSAFS